MESRSYTPPLTPDHVNANENNAIALAVAASPSSTTPLLPSALEVPQLPCHLLDYIFGFRAIRRVGVLEVFLGTTIAFLKRIHTGEDFTVRREEKNSKTGERASKFQKRQLFREHLLPEQGGKVPDSAFIPDRLSLNKMNQIGLFVPDGFFIQERRPNVYHEPRDYSTKTIQVNFPPNNVGVAVHGQSFEPVRIDTSYIIRKPFNYVMYPPLYHQWLLPVIPYSSLKLIRFYRQKKNEAFEQIFPSADDFPTKVFVELAPYLKKLHEYSQDG